MKSINEAMVSIFLCVLFSVLVLMLLAGCGTVTNATVQGYEQNVAKDEVQAGQNVLAAKVFALCLTPFIDIINAPSASRKAIQYGCIPSDAATESISIMQAVPAVPK